MEKRERRGGEEGEVRRKTRDEERDGGMSSGGEKQNSGACMSVRVDMQRKKPPKQVCCAHSITTSNSVNKLALSYNLPFPLKNTYCLRIGKEQCMSTSNIARIQRYLLTKQYRRTITIYMHTSNN